MRVVLHRDPSQGLIAAVLVVGAGAGLDPDEKEGAAHAIEHLAFRAVHQDRTIRIRLEEIGAQFNAWTGTDETAYEALAPAAERDRLLAILADIARAPLQGVEEQAFAAERNVVENERRFRNENGYPAEIFSHLGRALYGAGYHGKPVGGTAQSLESLTLADAQAFARSYYDPRRMTLLVAGDIGGDREKLSAPFTDLQPGDAKPVSSPPPVAEPIEKDTPIERIEAAVGTPELWLAWRLPGAYDEQRPALDALDGMAGAFWRGTRDDVISISAFIERGPEVSTLYVRTLVSSTASLDAVRFFVFHTLQTGISDAALDRDSRTIFSRTESTRQVLANEDLSTRAVNMALGSHYAKEPMFVLRQADALGSVSGDAIRELSKKYLI
ncbi:MAG TPA: pitrilysin family protein, partial [Polyangiaceae bacterium]|nr:pitrilysin family protein [Polyangiaceae bacterium]